MAFVCICVGVKLQTCVRRTEVAMDFFFSCFCTLLVEKLVYFMISWTWSSLVWLGWPVNTSPGSCLSPTPPQHWSYMGTLMRGFQMGSRNQNTGPLCLLKRHFTCWATSLAPLKSYFLKICLRLILFYLMCMSILHTCLYVNHVHAPCQQRLEEGIGC